MLNIGGFYTTSLSQKDYKSCHCLTHNSLMYYSKTDAVKRSITDRYGCLKITYTVKHSIKNETQQTAPQAPFFVLNIVVKPIDDVD